MSEQNNTKRIVYLDYLRIFSILAIVMLHVSAQKWGVVEVTSREWVAFNFLNGLVRWAVPVFVMMSGALFLGRDIPVRQIYQKNIWRMITAYFAWAFLYYLFMGDSCRLQLQLLFTDRFAERLLWILAGHYHMWFIPLIIGLYICTPILQQLVKNVQVTRYFLLVAFIFRTIIPQIVVMARDFGGAYSRSFVDTCDAFVGNMHMDLVMGFIFYYVLGYELSRIEFARPKRMAIYLLGVLGIVTTIVLNYRVSVNGGVAVENYYGNTRLNVVVTACAVFVLFRHLPFASGRGEGIRCYLAKCCFGVYLVHPLVIEQLDSHGIDPLTISATAWASTCMMWGLVVIISFAIAMLLNRIPIVKKYLV